jgi:glycosyltransferase involved in cell wall biosynthesis
VSVIIPCYNYAHFLPDAVASVAAQSCPNWELIVVDDGSADASSSVACAQLARFPGRRIRALRQHNAGPAAARNTGAAQAHGRYLVFLDADDMLVPTYLERCLRALDAHPDAAFAYSGMLLFGHDQHVWPGQPFDRHRLALDNFVPPPALVRRAAFAQSGGFDTSIAQGFEDWELWLRISRAQPGLHIPEPLVYYRRHADSLSLRSRSRAWDARALLALRNPELYAPSVVAWAARRCARRSIATAARRCPQPAQTICAADERRALAPAPAPALPAATGQSLPLPRRLVRRLPFRLRAATLRALRRAQLRLRALGLRT